MKNSGTGTWKNGGAQCDRIWQNFATWAKKLTIFGHFSMAYLVFGKIFSLFLCHWAMVVHGQVSNEQIIKPSIYHLVTLNRRNS